MNETEGRDVDLLRRTVMRAGAVAMGALALSAPATADEHENGNGNESSDPVETPEPAADVDEPDGFEVEILQGHTPFVDELSATMSLTFAEGGDAPGEDPVGSHVHLDDESTMVVAEVSWEPGGQSGWHRHPGVVLVGVLEGEIEVTWARDCVPRTYEAGGGFFDPGIVHSADNLRDDEGARAYAIFLGIPDGEPATEWVEPVDC